jgi:protein-tyrosine-phosphatase
MVTPLTPAQVGEIELRVRREADALAREFAGIFSNETVNRYVGDSLDSFRERPRMLEYVPIFVHRYARERLRALALAEGRMEKEVPEVLFVCVHNAGRSQMAAGFAAKLGGDRVHVLSAGSTPSDQINPAAIEAMAEAGIDLSQEFPKLLSDEVVRAADAVVTMGCGDACPIYPGKRYLDWELEDPDGQPIEVVRRIRDEIRGRVETLLTELGVEVR